MSITVAFSENGLAAVHRKRALVRFCVVLGRSRLLWAVLCLSVVLELACQRNSSLEEQTSGGRSVEALENRLAGLEAKVEQLSAQWDRRRGSAVDAAKSIAKLPVEPLDVKGLVAVGAPAAQIAIIEYFDFQCPYCRRYSADTWPLVVHEYVETGKVRYFFSQLPLESIHPASLAAAGAADCAGRQGRFLEMHDWLFENPRSLGADATVQYAAVLGLDALRFASCVANDAPLKVRAEISAAARLGVHSTPTFFVGRLEANEQVRVLWRIAGAQPFPVFKGVVEVLSRTSGKADQ